MFRFIEAEHQTMQPETKAAYYSLSIATSNPSDCDEKTISSSFFYLSDRNLTGPSVCDNHSEFWVLKWLMPVVKPTWTFQKHLQVFHIYLSAFCGFSPQANGSVHILPIPYQVLGEDCCILERKMFSLIKTLYIYTHVYIHMYMYTHKQIYILTSDLWFHSNLT